MTPHRAFTYIIVTTLVSAKDIGSMEDVSLRSVAGREDKYPNILLYLCWKNLV